MSEKTPQEEREQIRVFRLNDDIAEFEELEIDEDLPLYEILDSKEILLFIKPSIYRAYIWVGSSASTRMKFIAADKASNVRDQIGPAIKIATVDEGEETTPFKILIGLEKPEEYEEEQTGPAYTGQQQEDDLIRDLSLDKLLDLLEKIPVPEGYRREYIIEGKKILAYHEYYTEYLGEVIKERKLVRLENPVPDGPYFLKDLLPRVILSFNKVVATELLHKMTDEEIEKEKELEIKAEALKKKDDVPFSVEVPES